jgi:2-polyprenyl-6-methoxyphenol hydroxylase-like FAD-dependent oxidoreductase
MPQSQQTPILIVGAGPTGLLAACELAQAGADFMIIDGKDGPTRESRALAVQARSLEAYERLGVAGRAVAEGYKMRAMNFHANGKHRRRVPLGDIGEGLSPFPYMLILEQSKNEEILVARLEELGHQVRWGVQLQDLKTTKRNACAEVTTPEGAASIEADWLVAADGAGSTVRKSMSLNFPGGTYETLFYVADLQIEGDIPHTEGSIFFAREGFALIFPMDGQRRFRLVGIAPTRLAGEKAKPDAFNEEIKKILVRDVKLGEPNWFSVYPVHHRSIEQFRVGRVLLAGDAAHVHSPAGGQGMNTGLIDAQNLGWKLALVSNGRADARLLDSYHAERYPFAQRLLHTTDQAFAAATSSKPVGAWFRTNVVPSLMGLVLRTTFGRRFLFGTISQTGVNYRGVGVSQDNGHASKACRAGDRFPWISVTDVGSGDALKSHDLLNHDGFTLLDFGAPKGEDADAFARGVSAATGVEFRSHRLDCGDEDMRKAVSGRLFLVRPDSHIAFSDDVFNAKRLKTYLKKTMALAGA